MRDAVGARSGICALARASSAGASPNCRSRRRETDMLIVLGPLCLVPRPSLVPGPFLVPGPSLVLCPRSRSGRQRSTPWTLDHGRTRDPKNGPRAQGPSTKDENALDDHHGILERPYARYRDPHAVIGRERERVGRDYAGTGQQNCALGELLRAEQVLDELRKGAFDLVGPRLAGKDRLSATADLELNLPPTYVVFSHTDDNPRADRAGSGIDLRLR